MFQTEKFNFPVRKCQEKFVVDMTTSAFPALLKGKRGAPVTSSIVLNEVIEDLGFSFRKPGGSSPKAPDGGALAQTSAPGMEEPHCPCRQTLWDGLVIILFRKTYGSRLAAILTQNQLQESER